MLRFCSRFADTEIRVSNRSGIRRKSPVCFRCSLDGKTLTRSPLVKKLPSPLFSPPRLFGAARCCARRRSPRVINLPTSKNLTCPSRLHRPHQQLSRDHRPQPRRPLCRAAQSGLRHAGKRRRANRSAFSISATISCTISPTIAVERRLVHAPKLFHRPCLSQRWQTSLCLDGLDHRSHGREANEHRQRHRGLQVRDGRVTPERFIKIPPQPIAEGKEVAFGLRTTPAGTALPYPAGFAVLPARRAIAC
jgi:hypothetical protein